MSTRDPNDGPLKEVGHQVADEVVREVIARLGHRDVVPRITDKPRIGRTCDV
jgi:hypothetical protein